MLSSLKLLLLILYLFIPLTSVFASESCLQSGSMLNDSTLNDDFADEEFDMLDEEDDFENERIADPVKYWNIGMYHLMTNSTSGDLSL